MPTERRLINKKAYEELVLLKRFCAKQNSVDEYLNHIYYTPVLTLDENENEMFLIVKHSQNVKEGFNSKILAEIKGKNYNEITKALMEYLNER